MEYTGKVAFILAHYHKDGVLQESMARILSAARAISDSVTLVSTNLSHDHAARINASIKVIVRENVGYDFYSYKIGLDHLGDTSAFDHVVLINSSFVCVDSDKLLNAVLQGLGKGFDLTGLTASNELAPHVQSYLMAFSRRAIGDDRIADWWRGMSPISDRNQVIVNYELGLSAFVGECGFSLGAVYSPSEAAMLRGAAHAAKIGFIPMPQVHDGVLSVPLAQIMALNPTHFMWEELFERYGVMKRELIEKNPFQWTGVPDIPDYI